MSKKLTLIVAAIIIVSLVVGYFLLSSKSSDKYTQTNNAETPPATNQTNTNKPEYSIDDPSSLWIVVNKSRPISGSYVPEDLVKPNVTTKSGKTEDELSMRSEATSKLEQMFADAKTEGIDLKLGSGYRSYDLQNYYYTNYVSTYGQDEADKFSAKPGTSEHQTGWVADIAREDEYCYLEVCFDETTEGQWIKNNAHKYGFIIRYPQSKIDITGYQFEPWHVRYLGDDLANELNNSGQTLEEYFNLN